MYSTTLSKEANFIMVYGICLPQRGCNPLYNPAIPSVEVILFQPSRVPRANGGIVVCMRTLIASHGQRRISAKNSAEAEALR